MDTLPEEEKIENYLESIVKRRQLFKETFTREVMRELRKFFGLENEIYAFRSENGAPYDPYRAAQRDALFGVIRGITYEIKHLPDAEAALEDYRREKSLKNEIRD